VTTIADIEALGIDLPKTKRLRNGSTYSFMNMGQDAAEGTQAEIREATDELLAVIERLAGFGGASFEAGFQERQRAEQAEAEVERLNSRRCSGCVKWMTAWCPVEYERGWMNLAGDTPSDFACNRYQPGGESGWDDATEEEIYGPPDQPGGES